MKILEEGQIPEDRMAGMQHVGKSFRCPTCFTIVQIEASDIERCKKDGRNICNYDFERYIPCPKCGDNITFTLDELIHENVDPPILGRDPIPDAPGNDPGRQEDLLPA